MTTTTTIEEEEQEYEADTPAPTSGANSRLDDDLGREGVDRIRIDILTE